MQDRSLVNQSPTATHLADAVLRAWIGRDGAELRRELKRSLDTSASRFDIEEPDERLDLLRVVASRMMGFSEPVALPETDPEIRVCLKLLTHLAGCPTYRD